MILVLKKKISFSTILVINNTNSYKKRPVDPSTGLFFTHTYIILSVLNTNQSNILHNIHPNNTFSIIINILSDVLYI